MILEYDRTEESGDILIWYAKIVAEYKKAKGV